MADTLPWPYNMLEGLQSLMLETQLHEATAQNNTLPSGPFNFFGLPRKVRDKIYNELLIPRRKLKGQRGMRMYITKAPRTAFLLVDSKFGDEYKTRALREGSVLWEINPKGANSLKVDGKLEVFYCANVCQLPMEYVKDLGKVELRIGVFCDRASAAMNGLLRCDFENIIGVSSSFMFGDWLRSFSIYKEGDFQELASSREMRVVVCLRRFKEFTYCQDKTLRMLLKMFRRFPTLVSVDVHLLRIDPRELKQIKLGKAIAGKRAEMKIACKDGKLPSADEIMGTIAERYGSPWSVA